MTSYEIKMVALIIAVIIITSLLGTHFIIAGTAIVAIACHRLIDTHQERRHPSPETQDLNEMIEQIAELKGSVSNLQMAAGFKNLRNKE